MNIITSFSFIFLLITSTSAFSYTYKCKNDAGKIVYSGSACPLDQSEMNAETIAINGQRRLTADQIQIIQQHDEEARVARQLKAERLKSMTVFELRELEAEKSRLHKKISQKNH
ncbi:hypothetical protein [Candidatus Methylobacter oryzae]|uniref:DUF4124 domain-containing protein n=1 Tax=Candidatus Methylobacter oryzae TaxID=2497749 RepID=A0ABY3CCF4_9GAMM|nr:hypothetical protein [Candidatus Methylobacter oryzae]TRW98986.1 hypothetical protein EKO24_006820 [Candidatus Methylobacter oryzae]